MNEVQAKPWYRERWIWVLLAGPALVVAAGIVTTFLAVSGEDGLVADDYYRQGLAINRTLRREETARTLGVTAVLEISPAGDRIRVAIGGGAGEPAALRLSLVHATRAGQDQSIALMAMPDGAFEGRVRRIGSGPWRVILDEERRGWRLSGEWPADGGRTELRSGS